MLNLVHESKTRNKDSILKIIQEYLPLIKKYKRKLHYEDGENDLIEKLIHILYDLPELKEEDISKYIATSIKHQYIYLSKKYYATKNKEFLTNEFNHYCTIEDPLLLKLAIEQLTEKQKKIILYKYVYGYKIKEISHMMKLSRQSVYKHQKQAYETLKKWILN
ncbi:sigma-70 family RNA polymerase sigma factor [Longirhabdus pacifica]|uniref:sigma-70 family RNA polymerase sigma factor n=1 Tax=Longirhabdus pacifica TaxID=2305227 RepID=UPI001F0C18E8|nr:sigma-70 family RNA polymerase sigma factor [Longirhabdus pacifica]